MGDEYAEKIAESLMPEESTTAYYEYEDDPITIRTDELRTWLTMAATEGYNLGLTTGVVGQSMVSTL